MSKTSLLDCTLRDGGYINNWDFGNQTARNIASKLIDAGVDIIELGFLESSQNGNLDRTINPSTDWFEKIFSGLDKKSSEFVVMLDYGSCPAENLASHRAESVIDGIRVAFKKNEIDSALSFCEEIKSKNYKVFLQPVSITDYSEEDLKYLTEEVNQLNPYEMSIVDTCGLLSKNEIEKIFITADKFLNENIILGYHGHNNIQTAFSNSINFSELIKSRNTIIDGALYGMGRGAGNTPTELLIKYFNEKSTGDYQIEPIIEIIDTEISEIKKVYEWGYSLNYFVSSINKCHPNYSKYLKEKYRLSPTEINRFLQTIEPNKRTHFDKNYIDNLLHINA